MLRIEDIDGPRVVPGATTQLMEDLRDLGLDWDEGPDVGGAYGPYHQTERLALYTEALTLLRARGLVYPCGCSRKDIAIASAPHGAAEFGPVYPGTCRAAPSRRNVPQALRLRVPDVLPPVHDGLLGEVTPGARGDFIVQRADGTFSYQLAVVVDDIAMRITEVLRGADLAGCTGWQVALYEALGAKVPRFVHVPLLLDVDGKRLAKGDGAQSVRALRAQGVSAAALVGALAASCGLVPEGSTCTPAELLPGFALQRVRETTIAWDALLRSGR